MDKKVLGFAAVILLVLAAAVFIVYGAAKAPVAEAPAPAVTSFEECVAAGNPVMESYPRQCAAGGETFVEKVEDEYRDEYDEYYDEEYYDEEYYDEEYYDEEYYDEEYYDEEYYQPEQ